MRKRHIFGKLDQVFAETPAVPLSREDRFVFFSDLHLGDGSSRDDFRRNAGIFTAVLKQYYAENRFRLVLNGDIEELQRFGLSQIRRQWAEVYQLFDEFAAASRLFKIIGNHDQELETLHHPSSSPPTLPALKLDYDGNYIFVFHGHQASLFMEKFNLLCGLVLKYIANPIGIKNFSYSHDSTVRFKTEKQVYGFSRDRKIVSLIGHTHRPLFESLSKTDCLKFKIEQLCRDYASAAFNDREKLAQKIQTYNAELRYYQTRNRNDADQSSLYTTDPLVPCLFNSGSVIGKNGMTAIEIDRGQIQLVYWFDRNRSTKYFNFNGFQPEQLNDGDYFRVVLKQEPLDYIFTRIKLLA